MAKWVRFEKSIWGLSASIVMFNKVSFYCGNMDHWAVAIEVSHHDRSLTFKLFNLYAGVEIYHKALDNEDEN